MSSKLVKCKSCGAEIAKSAKICPQCGAKRKKNVLGIILLIVGVLLIFAAVGGNSSTDGPKLVETPPANSTPGAVESEPPTKTTFSVGESAELKEVIVTLNSVTESSGSQFNRPSEGNVFLLCEFTIENNSSKDLGISSLMCFEAYVDDFSTNMSLSALLETDKGQLDGTVAAEKKMNGVIGYEASKDYQNIEIRFTPDFWSGKDIIFVYEK